MLVATVASLLNMACDLNNVEDAELGRISLALKTLNTKHMEVGAMLRSYIGGEIHLCCKRED